MEIPFTVEEDMKRIYDKFQDWSKIYKGTYQDYILTLQTADIQHMQVNINLSEKRLMKIEQKLNIIEKLLNEK